MASCCPSMAGKFFQLDDVLGVEEEHGFNLNTDKYNWKEHKDHFILADTDGTVDFGEGKKNIFALPDTTILIQNNQEVQMAVKNFWKRPWCLCQWSPLQL